MVIYRAAMTAKCESQYNLKCMFLNSGRKPNNLVVALHSGSTTVQSKHKYADILYCDFRIFVLCSSVNLIVSIPQK